MRSFTTLFVLATLAGCATQHATTPREYLDQETAATVTVVSDPWIFAGKSNERTLPTVMDDRSAAAAAMAGERPEFVSSKRELISIYAIDVNRMGTHRQYLAVPQALPRVSGESASAAPILELRIANQTLSLQPIAQDPRELGIAKAPVGGHGRASQWSYFAVSRDTFTSIARSPGLQATLVVAGDRRAYEIWRDGSAEMAGLAAVLPE
ncbi:MAG TPA: hypothetical protein VGN07_03030 [Steroidobacteraceae bacterium]|jgi:hypothetical protein